MQCKTVRDNQITESKDSPCEKVAGGQLDKLSESMDDTVQWVDTGQWDG